MFRNTSQTYTGFAKAPLNIHSIIIPPPNPTPKKDSSFWKPPNVLKFKIWMAKNGTNLGIHRRIRLPSPTPRLTPSSRALKSVFVDFSLGGIMKLWTKFLTQLTKGILSLTWLAKCVMWSFNERFIRCIKGTYTFCLLYIRYSYGKVH